ncbi:S8 family serine peptidase [Winogradskyella sp. SYSU M77433]|uniref:S8 family serine peptidase n=1 Tax=Winogradskyella sp. SYSU M77433 TaxID=3042722 RepID=UPI002480F1AF|nr:S8 family serine peptidase [Winogradskyella sp. SYSU M77433]MDH7911759.1 S8 family serine peptidase [Winogradskyella sp. SYSU M77433]
MKKSYLVLSLIFFVSIAVEAQTKEEKAVIISNYNPTQISSLKDKINELNSKREDRINDYLISNPENKIIKQINGVNYHIFDVINGEPIYRSIDNVNSAIATRANFLNTGGGLGLNLDGQNMTVGVWDEGLALSNHTEFSNGALPPVYRVTTPDMLSTSTFDDHATHVTGTIVARGADPLAKGMAPQGNVVSYDWGNDNAEVVSEASNNALLISNHSYGIPVLNQSGSQNAPTWMMGCYNGDAALWDDIAYTFPYYLQVLSAGNDGQSVYSGGLAAGYDKLTAEKNSKNNLVVANVANPSIDANGEVLSMTINPSSSQGPSDDGRIKPDIAGDGTSVYSTVSTGISDYGTSTGTSMSSPNVAGSLILLQQYYNDLNSQYMRSATLKGLVCHTADDDSSREGPDPFFGWGLLNSKYAAEVIQNNEVGNSLISELTLQNGQTYTKSFTTSGTGPISVTICWTDPAGVSQAGSSNSSTPALVNDLDLRIIDAGGFIQHTPWKLLAFNINSGATKGDNNVDTVERVDIEAPIAGTYTIQVTHKGNLQSSSQDYSLIVTAPDLVLSNETYTSESFKIWPNPARSELNINFAYPEPHTELYIYDIRGRIVHDEIIENALTSYSMDISNLSPGSYILKLVNNGKVYNHKVIVN